MTEELEKIHSEAERARESYDEFAEQVYKFANIAYSHPELDVDLDDFNPVDMSYSSPERAETVMEEQINSVKAAKKEMKNRLYSLDESIAEYQHQNGHLDCFYMELPEEYEELREEQNNLEELGYDLQNTLRDLSFQIYTQVDDNLQEDIMTMNTVPIPRDMEI